jgi:hypothetical protein
MTNLWSSAPRYAGIATRLAHVMCTAVLARPKPGERRAVRWFRAPACGTRLTLNLESEPPLVPEVGKHAVVIGELPLIGRDDSEQLAMGWMAHCPQPRPGRQYVIEASIGVHRHRSKGVLI